MRKTPVRGRGLLRASIVAAAATAAVALGAASALAASPKIGSNSGGANIRTCASMGCGSKGWYVNGTTLTMVCWKTGQWVNPPDSDYGSDRWFKVNNPTEGFIHSSLVDNQVATPVCP